ncbi:hypothetical protein AAFC00_002276 [Neodothiora populina]|uniref:Fermentation associated protein n=1 Tax=Neodothiora populina TaxID=2781224 RepID=A0ABR3PGV7_9PEZI
MANGLTAQPLGQQAGFNWVFLIDVIVCLVLALFFLFYWNRAFATIVSYIIRAYTWHAYRAYIDITSLQLSLLGGRLFFKSIRYHGHNQTVLVHDGYITWRYWLRQVQDAEIFMKQRERPLKSPSRTSTDSLDEPVPASSARHSTARTRSRSRSRGARGDSTTSPSDSRSGSRIRSRSRNSSLGQAEAGKLPARPLLPCRIEVKVSGVEAFLYNQTPIYDTIIANLTGDPKTNAAPNAPADNVETDTFSSNQSPPEDEEKAAYTRSRHMDSQQFRTSFESQRPDPSAASRDRSSIPAFLRLFPVQIECKKAAAAVGNEHTPSVVTAKLDHAIGRIDADEAGSLDLYKLLFKFDFSNVNVAFKSNADFHTYQLQAAHHLSVTATPKKKKRSFFGLRIHRRIRKTVSFLRRLFTLHRDSNRSIRTASLLSNDELVDEAAPKLPGEAQWQGLARYLDDDPTNQSHEWDDVEYARSSQIVDCSKVKMNFYWDVPGPVLKQRSPLEQSDDVNGATPPEYGLDLFVEGGNITYGPWADRQRVILQQMFFPVSYCDARPAQRRTSDQIRLATVFKLYLCLEKDIVLRIPTRESSKDWHWQGRTETHRKDGASEPSLRKRSGKGSKKAGKGKKNAQKQQQQQAAGANVRPFGWIDVKVLADTTVNYYMDMYARKDRYCNLLDLDVKGTEIFSSVNHALLWRAGNLTMQADLSNPLGWNTLRKWLFKVTCHDLDLFILRDHMFLMTDLIADWAAGPPPDFYTFTPYEYGLDLNFNNFNLFLNGNDANIVNDPSDLEANNFLILRGEKLNCALSIPIDEYRPAQSGVTFDVTAHDLSLDLSNSVKMTLHTLLRDKRVATLKKLTLNGTQTFYSEQSPGLCDVLRMDIGGHELHLCLFGFLIRYFVNVKENYFGEFLHFKTLEEYQHSDGSAADTEANVIGRHNYRPANDLDVILCIKATRPTILLPSNIYSAETYVRAELPIASADLRVTNYYLDLQTDISPIAISWSGLSGKADLDASKPQILIDYASIVGHRLFGLPPTEPAYVDTWAVELGSVSGDCSLQFVENLAKAGRAFAFALADSENALPLAQTPPIPSITFLSLKTGSVCLWINDGLAATRICTDPIALSQNDRADKLFSSRMRLVIPNLTATCVEADSASRHHLKINEEPAKCMAYIQTSIELNTVSRKAHFHEEYRKQQQHIRRHDSRSKRAQFLIDRALDGNSIFDNFDQEIDGSDLPPPSMSLPGLPLPMVGPISRANKRAGTISSQSATGPMAYSVAEPPSPGTKADQQHPAFDSGGRTASDLSTVNLWSQFAAPDDHFSHVDVDLSQVPTFTNTVDYEDDVSLLSLSDGGYNFDANNDSDQHTLMIRLHPGIRVYVEPRISEPVLNIIDAVLPTRPIDVMDKFQIDVMSQVELGLLQRSSQSTMTELNLVIPSIDIRLCNDREGDMASIPSDMAHDQLDVNLSYLNLTLRQRRQAAKVDVDSMFSLHLTLESALTKLSNISAANLIQGDAIRLGVGDVLVWLVLSRTRSIHVSFKDLLAMVSGQQSTYLAAVFSKYAVIGTSIQKRADAIQRTAKARLRYLTDYLTGHSSVSADPPYLSRMTFVLRAFPDHFRNQDSWKIVARFRHIYDGLGRRDRAELENAIFKGWESTMKPSAILDQWAEWCSWDIPNIGKTHVFRMLLGDADAREPVDEVHPMELTLRVGNLHVSVESGHKSSDVSLGGLSLGLQIVPPSRPSGLMLVEENLRTKTIVQAHTALMMIRLDWEILDQAEDFIDIYCTQVAPAMDILPDDGGTNNVETDDNIFRQDIHIVVSNDRTVIELETINLRHVSEGENMQLSLIGTSRASEDYGSCISLLTTVGHASTELSSEYSKIYRTDLAAPNIYFDYRQRLNSDAIEINLGGSYKEMTISLQQGILDLLETADSVLADEVSYIKSLQQRVVEQHGYAPSKPKAKKPEKTFHFNVAFMAGKFAFTIALLQALNLSITGETANLKIRPKMGAETAFDIEAHLGEIEYALVRKQDGHTGQKATFHTPTASALVGVNISGDKVDLAVTAIIQRIMLEATSVQSALSIINRPEVQSVFKAMKNQVAEVQQRVTDIFPEKEPHPHTAAKGEKVFIYDVKSTLAGLKVVASAPAMSIGKARAELSFGFGSVRGVASNAGLKDSGGMPNVFVQIQDIGALLTLVENDKRHRCGYISLGISIDCSTHEEESGRLTREVKARSDALRVNIFAETACTVVDIVTHVQRKILDLDLSREVEYIRRLRHSREKRRRVDLDDAASQYADAASRHSIEVASPPPPMTDFSLDLRKIRVAWVTTPTTPGYREEDAHDLELSFTRISLMLQKQNEARLSIQNFQLQVVPKSHPGFDRADNSALLPEVVFTVRYATVSQGVKVAFNASGQALDLRLDAGFVLPVSLIHESMSQAISKYHAAAATWQTESSGDTTSRKNPFGDTRLVQLQADARFDGAHFRIQGDPPPQFHASMHQPPDTPTRVKSRRRRGSRPIIETSLRVPGIAVKLEFNSDDHPGKSSVLNGEIKVDASSNTVYPQLVPIVLQISDNVKQVVRKAEAHKDAKVTRKSSQVVLQEKAQDIIGQDSLLTKDPSALIGKLQLNLGLRICQQEFGLSCQPIARVNAKAQLEDIYITMNTINSEQFGHFFALSATFTKLGASVQHVYSRESTFSFEMESIALSLMNSKHLGAGSSGVSAVLKIAPTRTALNARQVQDLLLFREIWFPDELRSASAFSGTSQSHAQEEIMVQKYQHVSAAAAFPWSATISIADLAVDLDLGQSIGKSSFTIKNMWACSKKSSTWKQDLCIGLDAVGINSTGRMSGFVELEQIAVRSSIEWPTPDSTIHKAPLVQASIGFGRLRAKSSFDYQPFGFVDVEEFNLLMYNIRDRSNAPDRLVAILDGNKVFAFCTSTSAAQALGLYQAFDRLVQEKQTAYKESMRDLAHQLKRRSVSQFHQRPPSPTPSRPSLPQGDEKSKSKYPITLHSDVVVKLRQIAFGAFPGTFFDNQVLKLEASDVAARFAVGLEDDRIHSHLGMTLGQLQAALGSVKKVSVPKTLGDISIDEVIVNATGAKGGTILRVPRVVANMQTWQVPSENKIDFIFKSLFEGKVDVGWNYSRISQIRAMWNTHSRTLAARLGKALPESAVKIRSPSLSQQPDSGDDEAATKSDNDVDASKAPQHHQQPPAAPSTKETSADAALASAEQDGKITAVVNVPQSKYEYNALEPPVIETPQLRDMGEATPPLEWIGLHRDRLPNVTHQIVIVTLLEIAKEVEDAYDRILGSA